MSENIEIVSSVNVKVHDNKEQDIENKIYVQDSCLDKEKDKEKDIQNQNQNKNPIKDPDYLSNSNLKNDNEHSDKTNKVNLIEKHNDPILENNDVHLYPNPNCGSKVSDQNNATPSTSINNNKRLSLFQQIQNLSDDSKLQKDMKKVNKFAYLIGNVNIALTVFLASKYPAYFCVYYLVKMILLFPIVFQMYYDRLEHWFLIEICWFVFYVQFALLLWSLVDTSENEFRQRMWNVMYLFTCGFLSWAALIFNNRLIVTSIYSTASVFIHLSPMVLMYCVYWHSEEVQAVFPGINIKRDYDFAQAFGDVLMFYVFWNVCWNLLNMTWVHGYKDDDKYQYSWKYNKKKFGIDALPLFSWFESERVKMFLYSLCHLVLAMTLIQFTWILDINIWVYFAWMLFVFGYCIWNGAVYMERG